MKLKNEIDEVKKWEEKIRQKDLVCKINRYKYDFQKYETIIFFDFLFPCSSIVFAFFSKQSKTIEEQGKKNKLRL